MNNLVKNNKLLILSCCSLALAFFAGDALAAAKATNLGAMASAITSNLASVAKLITAGAYAAGLGFAIGAIMKFKAHKDNPTQITIGTPIALLFIAGALLFLPSILSITGGTTGLTSKAGVKGTTSF